MSHKIYDKHTVIRKIIGAPRQPSLEHATEFAPTNIALCKYWGKRDIELNLPFTGSLSIALSGLGACTRVSLTEGEQDIIYLNKNLVAENAMFSLRLVEFLDFFRPTPNTYFRIDTQVNIPVAAGLASSACGFAALIMAMNKFFAWDLPESHLSILARMGSGSACRSLWNGFVEWHAGSSADGMDSYAQQLDYEWPELCVGILLLNDKEKSVSSRDAMQTCVDTSPFYSIWPKTVATAIEQTHHALINQDFWLLGSVAEANALAMHALMLSTTPPIIYSQANTLECMHKVWRARAAGLPLFFTQDAGPNLKLLFLQKDVARVLELFAEVQLVEPFANSMHKVFCPNE